GATAGNEARAIPLMTEPSKDPFPNRSRSTVKEVYDLLVSDLLTAIQLLPDGFRNGIDPIEYQDRATRDAARFLLARVYFQMKDFAKARLQADTVLNSNRYTLTEAPIEAWNKSGLNQRGREVVWQYVQYSTSQQQWKGTVQGAFMGFTSRGNNNINGGRILSASDAFTNEVGWGTSAYTITALPANRPPAVIPTANNFVLTSTDRRLAQLWRAIPAGFDPRPEYTGYTRTYLWCNKFNRWPGGNNNLTSFPLMRSAELYLTRAFIRLREGDRTGAAADLNAVRTRAGLPAVAEADVTENMIHIERRREMAFEQDRVFYLQAVGINIPPGDRSGVGALDWRSPNFGFPIPAFETNINPNAGN
ncbi:MAG: RagB/SusD family nutrient uptake outer membrane protein, partial [Chitinophagaceae bacterium]|nr:RagB/SusD family nutrient uptake outer membrane protein [Chitinophagaceae bacterium]